MDYKLYQSDLIVNNHKSFISNCTKIHNYLLEEHNTKDSTWDFYKYNIFQITSSSILFYKLFKELNLHIRNFIGNDKPLWMQCWLNYHKSYQTQQSLKPHGHPWDYHGYISIEPQNTTTIFHKGYKIQNKIGQIYIGKGNGKNNKNPELTHYVKINKPYNGNRITLGFDLTLTPNANLSQMKFIPIL